MSVYSYERYAWSASYSSLLVMPLLIVSEKVFGRHFHPTNRCLAYPRCTKFIVNRKLLALCWSSQRGQGTAILSSMLPASRRSGGELTSPARLDRSIKISSFCGLYSKSALSIATNSIRVSPSTVVFLYRLQFCFRLEKEVFLALRFEIRFLANEVPGHAAIPGKLFFWRANKC